MTNATTGVKFNVFDNIITKYGDDVTRIPVTKTTSNQSGDETLTDGTSSSIRVYIVRTARPYTQTKDGLVENGDATMLVKRDQTVNKNDKITWQGNTYRIQTVLDRDQLGGNIAYKYCKLFLMS
jgi:hypothetical protein